MNGARPRAARPGEASPDSAAPDEEAAPGDSPPGAERLPRSHRIRHTEEIRGLLRRGKRTRTSNLDAFVASSPVPHPRLGLIVPKHRRRVVDRNRLKRRLRELGRRRLLPALAEAGISADILIRARPDAYDATFEELRRQVLELAHTLCRDASSWA